MYAISAADAISPAVQRTKEFLFRPFKWSTFLKLGLVALLTEGLGSNFRSTSSSHNKGGYSAGSGPNIHSLSDIQPLWIAEGVAILLLLFVIGAVIFYVITRLRFAFFHCLVHNTKEIRPGWDLYKERFPVLLAEHRDRNLLPSSDGVDLNSICHGVLAGIS